MVIRPRFRSSRLRGASRGGTGGGLPKPGRERRAEAGGDGLVLAPALSGGPAGRDHACVPAWPGQGWLQGSLLGSKPRTAANARPKPA